MMRQFINWQMAISVGFDRLFPQKYCLDGQTVFQRVVAPRFISKGMTIYDVGAGKRPYITRAMKDDLTLTVIGLDIDQRELDLAPEGAYTRTVCADISVYEGNRDADLVICQAVLEHVLDVGRALRGIASILRPGGAALIFLPCRNALYARLNTLLPQRLKRKLLFTIFPNQRRICGFPSYYDRCTPRGISKLAAQHKLLVREIHPYYYSPYFTFFFPFHLIWRAWSLFSRAFAGDEGAETFTIILEHCDPMNSEQGSGASSQKVSS